MKDINTKSFIEENKMTGVVIVGFDDKEGSLSISIEGEVSIGIVAIEIMSVFFKNIMEKDEKLSTEDLSSIAALICTKALQGALGDNEEND